LKVKSDHYSLKRNKKIICKRYSGKEIIEKLKKGWGKQEFVQPGKERMREKTDNIIC
jgi:hypothetical protein